MKYVQGTQKRHQNNASGVVLVCLLLTLNKLHTFFSISIGNFEHIIAGLVKQLPVIHSANQELLIPTMLDTCWLI